MIFSRGSGGNYHRSLMPFNMPSTYMSISSGSSIVRSLNPTSIESQCIFNVHHESSRTAYQYNICPLFIRNDGVKKIQVIKDEDTPPTHTRHVYDIAMMGTNGLEWDGTLPSTLQCPKGTWICLTVINSRPDRPSDPLRILQVIPISTIAKSNPKANYVTADNQQSQLQVAFHGGRYMGRKHKALFHFTCDHDTEHSSPTPLWSFNGTHTFSWASKHGCPKSVPISTIDSIPTATSPPDSEPSDIPPELPEDSDIPEDVPANIPLQTGRMAGFAFIFSLIFWMLCTRRISRLASSLFGNTHLWLSRRTFTQHRRSNSDVVIHPEDMSVLLEDFAIESREPLSPKTSAFPKYGL